MGLSTHPAYEELAAKARASHEQGRNSRQITADDIALARLYSYALRMHTIGAYHATRQAVLGIGPADALTAALLDRAAETLEDLANQGMEQVPDDFRVVVSTFYRYDRGVRRAIDALERAAGQSRDPQIARIGEGFAQSMSQIASGNGIHLTQDTEAPAQASFIVPNLGITIVPLVYGDHHSWNLAHLNEEHLDVPWHRHYEGVEIHLGYNPLEGYMILDQYKSPVTEGYALPIPPMTRHGWANTTGRVHHVPFIFGSLIQGGWGVFLDVEAQPMPLEEMQTVDRTSWQMSTSVFMEREIEAMGRMNASRRQTLIPAAVTNRSGSGGLELSMTRATAAGFDYAVGDFRAVSIVRGGGSVKIGQVEREVKHHDHFGVPRGMKASVMQVGDEPLVLLDSLIRPVG